MVLGVIVYLRHVRHGGFYSDDWALAAGYELAPSPRFANAVHALNHVFGTRPLLSLLKPLSFAVFGLHSGWHLALAVALGVAVSCGVYALLRALAAERVDAALIAALVLVFPWSDSVRLWSTASLNQVALCLYLAGAVVAVRGLALARRPLLHHAAALVLYAAALLIYEAPAGLILIGGVLYWIRAEGSWKAVWPRWAADVAVVAAVVGWSASTATAARSAPSLHATLTDLPGFAHQALVLVGRSFAPGVPGLIPVVLGMLALFAGALRRFRVPGLGRWAAMTSLAALAAVAGFAPLVGSGLHPLDQGLNNRGNLAAALGLCALVYAVLAFAVRLFLPLRWRGGLPALATAAAIGVIGALYTHQVRGDIIRWDRAAALQRAVLAAARTSLPSLPAHTTVYVSGFPALVAPGVSVFSEPWDLTGAIQLQHRDATLAAYPVVQGVRFVCGASSIYPMAAPAAWDALQGGYGMAQGARYGSAIFLDATRRKAHRVTSVRSCGRAQRYITLAPLVGQAASGKR